MYATIFSIQKIPNKPIYSYTGGRSVGCLAPWHAYVRGRAEEDQPGGVGLLWKPNWHELDTEGLLAWCGIHTCDATTQLGDRSARVPMKVVTSCDKLRVGACMPKIRRWLNRTSCFFGNGRVSDREPTELKHLSRWRK